MKPEMLFKTIAGTLLLIALALAIFTTAAVGMDKLTVLSYLCFLLLLGISALCLAAGGLFHKIEDLENRLHAVEKELQKREK